MAWIEGAMADTAVGTLITVFDAALVQNEHWDIFDAAAGTNRKVYRCRRWAQSGESASLSGSEGQYEAFYFDVNDNIGTSYATVGLWEDWDAGAHAGVGASVTSRYIRKAVGDYAFALNDTRFILVMWQESHATYVGLPILAREDYFSPMIVAISANPTTAYYNPLSFPSTITDVSAVCIKYWSGLTGTVVPINQATVKSETRACRTPDGAVVWETPLIVSGDARFLGWLDGAMACGGYESFANGDRFTIDGIDWYVVRDYYLSSTYATMCVVKAA